MEASGSDGDGEFAGSTELFDQSGKCLAEVLERGFLGVALAEREFPEQGYPIRRPAVLRARLAAYAAAISTTATYSKILDAATAGLANKPARRPHSPTAMPCPHCGCSTTCHRGFPATTILIGSASPPGITWPTRRLPLGCWGSMPLHCYEPNKAVPTCPKVRSSALSSNTSWRSASIPTRRRPRAA